MVCQGINILDKDYNLTHSHKHGTLKFSNDANILTVWSQTQQIGYCSYVQQIEHHYFQVQS